jgi:cellulose synthase/poly-beta-1,6-N-acetylglucosamine synthase-like glycosyltransferase
MIMKIVFFLSLLFIVYAYFGYPLMLVILSLFRDRPVRKEDVEPTVSFVVAAFNEEGQIGKKIENTIGQNYPKEKLEIIIASDGSTDRTDNIVGAYRPEGVIHLRIPERKGKENAQKQAISRAKGEILIFSDVATILPPAGVSTIVRNFRDASVGCVSSVDKFIDKYGTISGEGAYVKYEMMLRTFESRVNTLVGLSGSFFAARREVCQEWVPDLQSDFNTVLNSVKLGLRGVSDPDSIGYYKNIEDERKEFERKVRTVIRGITVFMKRRALLNPLKYGLFSWQLLSHKLCRWLVPFALIILFFSNMMLVLSYDHLITSWTPFLILQLLFYFVAIVGSVSKPLASISCVKIPSFFVTVNVSIFVAWLKYFNGTRMASWEPSRR